MTIGEEIKRLRVSNNITQIEIGFTLGVGESTVRMWELGRNKPNPETLSKLALVLNVSKLHLYKVAGYLDDTDIIELLEENKRLHDALKSACNSLGADIEDYL